MKAFGFFASNLTLSKRIQMVVYGYRGISIYALLPLFLQRDTRKTIRTKFRKEFIIPHAIIILYPPSYNKRQE